MEIVGYKLATKAVEQAPVKKVIRASLNALSLAFNPDGTVSSVKDHLSWDFDKVKGISYSCHAIL